jgi:hypothetical protein
MANRRGTCRAPVNRCGQYQKRANPAFPSRPWLDEPAEDDLLVDMIDSVARDVLERIGDSPDARFEFFRRFVELAKEITHAAAHEAPTTCQ